MNLEDVMKILKEIQDEQARNSNMLKELLDIGAISQQEFENNKKKLLASS